MINYISMYENPYDQYMNDEIIVASQDDSIIDYAILEMKEFEQIENIDIEKIEVVEEQDEVDINEHMVNINFKKKDMSSIEIPKLKFINPSRYGEVNFTIRVHTNLNEKVIVKKILIPLKVDGYYENNGKKMKDIWQIVDEATYSQRGKNTMKSRMPIIIYQNKRREITDVNGNTFVAPSYSYALNGKQRKGIAAKIGKKPKVKFINPIMIFSAKMGLTKTIEFFGMKDIVSIVNTYDNEDLDYYYFFAVDEVYIKVNRELYNKYDLVKSFVVMTYNIKSPKDFPVSLDVIDDKKYWVCRIGTVGAARNKHLMSFYEKGSTNIFMIERLLNAVTKKSLRLPEYYKKNIYYILYWMITNFDDLRRFTNTDMRNKRIRKNEVIVNATLGKKISENINKLIEKKSRSKMNNMDTLLELFNFPSNIIITGMRNLNDILKSDDIVNDMDFLESIAFTNKGYQSLGEGDNKKIALKYRYVDPSMVGVLDLNVSSNSDIGMSGSFVPWVKLYDGFYFTPEKQPCQNRYLMEKSLQDEEGIQRYDRKLDNFDTYLEILDEDKSFDDLLKYEKIEIVEKTPEELEKRSKKQRIDFNAENNATEY